MLPGAGDLPPSPSPWDPAAPLVLAALASRSSFVRYIVGSSQKCERLEAAPSSARAAGVTGGGRHPPVTETGRTEQCRILGLERRPGGRVEPVALNVQERDRDPEVVLRDEVPLLLPLGLEEHELGELVRLPGRVDHLGVGGDLGQVVAEAERALELGDPDGVVDGGRGLGGRSRGAALAVLVGSALGFLPLAALRVLWVPTSRGQAKQGEQSFRLEMSWASNPNSFSAATQQVAVPSQLSQGAAEERKETDTCCSPLRHTPWLVTSPRRCWWTGWWNPVRNGARHVELRKAR